MADLYLEYMRLSDLEAWPGNPKDHDLGLIGASIGRFGFLQSPLIDERSGRLIAGHGRIAALAKMAREGRTPPDHIRVDDDGMWRVPVQRGHHFEDDQAALAYLVADNQLTAAGGWDDPKLLAALTELEADGLLGYTGFDTDDLDALAKTLRDTESRPLEDRIPQPRTQDCQQLQEAWQTAPGQVWRVPSKGVKGHHLIVCADSASRLSVDQALGIWCPHAKPSAPDDISDLTVFTDPPYNVGADYRGAFDDLVPEADYEAWCCEWFDLWHSWAKRIIFTPGAVNLSLWYRLRPPKWMMIWVKKNQKSRNRAGGFNAYEPLLLYGDVQCDYDVYEMTVDNKSYQPDHPTAKTLKAWVALVDDLCPARGRVIDPFLGCATTLIACEETGRLCLGIERYAPFVAVALERLKGAGLEPHLLGTLEVPDGG